ncbi:MAG: hypothetical protein ACRDQF_18580 [Thermocrispum sp.]
MTEPNDLDRRVSRLENEMADMRGEVATTRIDAAAARALAAGADHDVSEVRGELRAHTAALNALRETQLEQGRDLVVVKDRLGSVEGRLGSVEGRLGSVENQMLTVHQGINRIIGLLESDADPA